MARTLTAYLARKDVPELAQLQKAVDTLTFNLSIDTDYTPFETAGYLPCTLDGEDAGFDLRFKNAGSDLPAAVQSHLAGRDIAVTLKWSGDPREEMAALVFCAALAKSFDAIVQDGDLFVSVDQLVKKASSLQE
jgi:hypothetical protein